MGLPNLKATLILARAHLQELKIIYSQIFVDKVEYTLQEIMDLEYGITIFNTTRDPEDEKISWFRCHKLHIQEFVLGTELKSESEGTYKNMSTKAIMLQDCGTLIEMNQWEHAYQQVLIEDYGLKFGQRLFTARHRPASSTIKNPTIFKACLVVVPLKFVPVDPWGPNY
jgi:hypothetical protein